MKKLLLTSCFLIFTNSLLTQEIPETYIDSMLVNVDKSSFTTGILYDRVMPFAQLATFNDTDNNTSSLKHFEQALNEMYNASIKKKFEFYRDTRKKYANSNANTVKIGLINASFQMLNYNAINEGKGGLLLDKGKFKQNKREPVFLSKHILVVAPLKDYAKGPIVTYNFDSNLLFEESSEKLITLMANFDNKQEHLVIENGKPLKKSISIKYNVAGYKTLKFVATFSDGTSKITYGKLHVKLSTVNTKSLNQLVEDDSITANIPFVGYGYGQTVAVNGKIDYRTFYHTNNGNTQKTLLKPIVIIDGFDPGDKRKIEDKDKDNNIPDNDHLSIVEMMSYVKNNDTIPIVPILTDLGYDVVIVNHPTFYRGTKAYDGGADYIERNAMAHIALYQRLNSKLAQNGSTEQLVIVGPSMGGQISRYALAYMEKYNMPHNTRLWVSVDSPHLGANIPIGIQSLINLMDAIGGSPAAHDFYYDRLKSPAANQQLIEQHKIGHLPDYLNNGSPIRQQYMTNLTSNGLPNSNGYPQNLRKIAMVNGSLSGAYVGGAGVEDFRVHGFVDHISGANIKVTELSTKYMPVTGSTLEVTRMWRKFLPLRTATYTNNNPNGSMDIVPGGLFDSENQITESAIGTGVGLVDWGNGLSMIDLFFGKLFIFNDHFESRTNKQVHTFIPTVSALGFKNPNFNWGQKLNRNLLCNNEIPFDNYYGPKINERHTSFTEESVTWLLAELAGNPQPPTVYLMDSDIVGSSSLCAGEIKTYTIDACKISGTVNWQVSSSLQIISSTNHSVSVKPINSQVGEMGYVRAVTSTGTIKKEVWVGNPNPNLLYFERMFASSPHTLTSGSNQVVVTHGYSQQGITSYNWNIPFPYNNLAPNGMLINISGVYGSSADISIQATNKCGQSSFSNPTTFTIIGGYYFRIYPNPATETLTIERESIASNRQVGNTKQEKSFYKLYNFNNSLLLEGEIENLKNITVSSLKKGMYILKIVSGKSSETHHIIIK